MRFALPLLLLAACSSSAAPPVEDRDADLPIYRDPTQPIETRVEDLLGRMTLDEKIGQMTMSDRRWGYVEPETVNVLGLGGVISGGDSAPEVNTPAGWADTIDAYQNGALTTRLGIPIFYGTDAVHGHALMVGSTVFPHNVNLGATRDPELARRVGEAAGAEIAATGVTWAFAPVVAVTRDDHWGRVYESFGEKPELPTMMTPIIDGLQSSRLLATAKHYVGDGGTLGGDDQGDTVLSEAELRALHLPPFIAAIEHDVGAIMASYSKWNGVLLHTHRYLITDVLKGELGFTGIVVTDWNGAELIDGAYGYSAVDVRAGIDAGIDVFMVIESYYAFIHVLRGEVQAGNIPVARIDASVRRILRKKLELGLFEQPYIDRSHFADIGSPAHRAIAREAVQKSVVVLKNDGVLPIGKSARIFVAGKNADDLGHQMGGWTVTWQGGSGPTTPGTTILAGIREHAADVTFSASGDGFDATYDVAVAVIGEAPYAEYEGDREDDLRLDAVDQALLQKLAATEVPLVVVLVSGRPLDVSAELAAMDAFVPVFLPGSEGGGVADVLFAQVAPTGKLPLTWMQSAAQQPINDGDGQTPRFPFGAGLTYPAVSRKAHDTIRAESFDGQQGTQLEPCHEAGCGQNVGWIAPGDFLYYDDVEFSGEARFLARIASGASSGAIELRLDSLDGPLVATLPVSPTGGWTAWTTRTTSTSSPAGRHRLYLRFVGPGGDFVNLSWFRFE
jgi:beta-glucosidase